MSDVAPMLALLVTAGLALARGIHRGSARDKHTEKIWKLAARRLGGEATTTSGGLFGSTSCRLEAKVGRSRTDLTLTATTDTSMASRSGRPVTRCRTGVLEGLDDVDLQITPRGLLDPLTRFIGRAELRTGDDAFDERFRVVGTPGALVRELLNAPLRRRIARLGEGCAVEGRVVVMEGEGHPEEADVIVGMAHYAEDLVDRWYDLARAPCRLAVRLGLEPIEALARLVEGRDAAVARGLLRGHEVTMSARLDPERLLVAFSFDSPGGDFALEKDGAATSARGAADERDFALFAETSTLRSVERASGRLRVTFGGLSPPEDEVAAALDALLSASAGAYR